MDVGILRVNLWLMNVANDIEDTYATTRDSKIHINAFSQYKYEDDLIVIKMFVSLSVDPKERCHDLMIRYGNLVGPRLSDWFAHTVKWTPMVGQRGSVFKVESDIVVRLPVRAV
jgi:hypothetical protein